MQSSYTDRYGAPKQLKAHIPLRREPGPPGDPFAHRNTISINAFGPHHGPVDPASSISKGNESSKSIGIVRNNEDRPPAGVRRARPRKEQNKCLYAGCGKTFCWPKDLCRHLPIHDPNRDRWARFKCPMPDCLWSTKGFKRRDGLVRHVRSAHKDEGGDDLLIPGDAMALLRAVRDA